MTKGSDTKQAILRQAMVSATRDGLEGLTIGVLSKQVGMSKSGLFAHFGSKEELQVQVVEYARDRFVDAVILPALQQPRGIPRLEAFFANWLRWLHEGEHSGACLFTSASFEFEDKPGRVRDDLTELTASLREFIIRALSIAVAEGHLRSDTPIHAVAFSVHSLIIGVHMDVRFLRRDDQPELARQMLEQLLLVYRTPSH